MPQGSTTFHESEERLRPATRDMHRAIVSLMEELEAVDWYQQRMDATDDDELREILRHNRDEEKEHAAMVLEWIRRRGPGFDAQAARVPVHRGLDHRARGRDRARQRAAAPPRRRARGAAWLAAGRPR